MSQKSRIIMIKIKLTNLRKKLVREKKKMIERIGNIQWLIVNKKDGKLTIKIVRNRKIYLVGRK